MKQLLGLQRLPDILQNYVCVCVGGGGGGGEILRALTTSTKHSLFYIK
jgi:tRNA A37 threonylcarbamoyladenosine dehydratase